MKRHQLHQVKREISGLLKVPTSKITQIKENQRGLYSTVIFAKANRRDVVFKRNLLKKAYPQNTEKVALRYLKMRGFDIQPDLLAKSLNSRIQSMVRGRFFSRSDLEIVGFAKTLKQLHSTKFKKFGTFGKGRPRKPGNIKDFFNHWYGAYFEYTRPCISFFRAAKNSIFTKVWLPKVVKSLGEQKDRIVPFLTKGENSLIHVDLHNENIITKGSSVKLVDWDNAQVGDPALDVAAFLNIRGGKSSP